MYKMECRDLKLLLDTISMVQTLHVFEGVTGVIEDIILYNDALYADRYPTMCVISVLYEKMHDKSFVSEQVMRVIQNIMFYSRKSLDILKIVDETCKIISVSCDSQSHGFQILRVISTYIERFDEFKDCADRFVDIIAAQRMSIKDPELRREFREWYGIFEKQLRSLCD